MGDTESKSSNTKERREEQLEPHTASGAREHGEEELEPIVGAKAAAVAATEAMVRGGHKPRPRAGPGGRREMSWSCSPGLKGRELVQPVA